MTPYKVTNPSYTYKTLQQQSNNIPSIHKKSKVHQNKKWKRRDIRDIKFIMNL